MTYTKFLFLISGNQIGIQVLDQDLEIHVDNDSRILINGIDFNDLTEAPVRREPLARATTSINMSGHKKFGYYPLLLSGKLIPVSVQLDQQAKFSKLQVGK